MHIHSRHSDSALESAMVDRALVVIDAVLRRRCRNWAAGRGALDDLRGEIVVRLLRRLRDAPPIENFDAYVAGIASRVVDDAFRCASPEWTRLKNRIRYLVTHDGRFAAAEGGGMVSQGTGPARVNTAAAEELAAIVTEVVRGAGGAVAIDEIVSAAAQRLGVSDRVTMLDERLLSAEPAPAIESAEAVGRLWSEIALLPPRQRAALLLHARDAAGDSVLRLLVDVALVPVAGAAAALEVAPRALARLLEELPFTDSVIAQRLGVTPQQVINLRKAARDRLARRLAYRR